MSLVTPDQGYPYPLDTDLAAVPADLQALALAIDAQIAGWLAAFAASPQTPMIVVKNTAAGAALTSLNTQFVPFDTVVFQRGGFTGNGFVGAWEDVFVPATFPAGWWFVGAFLAIQNGSGAATPTTYANAQLQVTSRGDGITPSVDTNIQSECVITGDSFDAINLSDLVYLGPNGGDFETIWTHNDNAQTKLISAGLSYMWAVRLGDAT